MKPIYIIIIVLVMSALVLVWMSMKRNVPIIKYEQERYDTNEHDMIEQRYRIYKENIDKYRLGKPKAFYDHLDQRIHQAPDPGNIFVPTLQASNKMFFNNSEMDNMEYCDMMNRK